MCTALYSLASFKGCKRRFARRRWFHVSFVLHVIVVSLEACRMANARRVCICVSERLLDRPCFSATVSLSFGKRKVNQGESSPRLAIRMFAPCRLSIVPGCKYEAPCRVSIVPG